jgi:hypothetical protein
MRNFLSRSYPSKIFMPAIGVATSTLHKWAARGYIHLGKPGTGKSVVLYGKEILYAACLNIISRAGGSLHDQIKGLQDCVNWYHIAWRDCLPHKKPDANYCVYKIADIHHYDLNFDGEWEVTHDPTGNFSHVVELSGTKAEPFYMVINLEEVLRRLILKIDGRTV